MCAFVFCVTYIPITFIAMFAFKHVQSAHVLRVASVILIIGAWVRYLSNENKTFMPLLLGQTIISCGYAIMIVPITLIANKWFTDEERELIIAVCSICIPAGNLLAYFWTGIAFEGVLPESPENVYTLLYKLLLV